MTPPPEDRGEATDGEPDLERDIGLLGAVSLGVGTMIAGGIFVLSGLAVSNVGAAAVVSFLLAAVVASLTALTYAEFAAIYTVDGGGYEYVVEVFDSELTFFVGWLMILGYPASAAFYLGSFAEWFRRFVAPAVEFPAAIPHWSVGLAVLGVLVAVNLLGAEETGTFQVVVTALKVALIVLFLWGGLRAFDPGVVSASMARNLPHLGDMALTSALVFITFFGFEAIATSEGEIEAPERTVPRAIFFSLGLVTVLYALVVVVVVLAVNDETFLRFLADHTGLESPARASSFVAENGEVAMGRAAQYYLGDAGFWAFVLGALLSMVSAANATVLAGSRVKLAMARHGHLPGRFERIHTRHHVPHYAVFLTGVFIAAFLVVFTAGLARPPGPGSEGAPGLHLGLDAIAHFADFMLLSGLAAVNVALVRSRRKYPDRERPFEVPGVPWVPGVAVLSNLALLANVRSESLLLGLFALAVGAVVRAVVVDTG
jgi:APA family basic amino acid/polyamine antiporter